MYLFRSSAKPINYFWMFIQQLYQQAQNDFKQIEEKYSQATALIKELQDRYVSRSFSRRHFHRRLCFHSYFERNRF